MRHVSPFAPVLPLALALAACGDTTTLTTLDAGLLDPALGASQAGVVEPGFAFLPPIGEGGDEQGPLITDLLPLLAVRVCVVEGEACTEVVAELSAEGEAGTRIRVAGNHFQANWRSDRGLDPERDYRLVVLVGPMEMAHADIDLVRGGKAEPGAKKLQVQVGSTLPVEFHIGAASIWGGLPSGITWNEKTDVAGAVGQLLGAVVPPDAELALFVGGAPAPVRAVGDGRVLAALPLFLGDGLWPEPPSGPTDLLLFADGEPVAWKRGAVTVTVPAEAPGTSKLALTVLRSLAESVQELAESASEPGVEQGWMLTGAAGFAGLVDGPGPSSLRGALEAADAEQLRLLDAWLAASGVYEALRRLATNTDRVVRGLSAVASAAADVPGAPSAGAASAAAPQLAPGDTGTQLPANILAERMQLYEVSALLGEVVIAETANEFGLYVGLAAGAIALVQAVPTAGVTAAVLSVADFAVDKLLIGLLPAVIDEVSLDIEKTALQPGEETIAEVRIQASNKPPPIGLQDIIGQALNALGLAPGGARAQSMREVLEHVADFYLQTMRSAIAAYASANPNLDMDVTVTSVPSMTWWSNVFDETLIEPLSFTPDVVAPLTDEINWVASNEQLGEGAVLVRTVTGPESHRLDLPPSIPYTGGAFGVGVASSPPVTLNVVGALAGAGLNPSEFLEDVDGAAAYDLTLVIRAQPPTEP